MKRNLVGLFLGVSMLFASAGSYAMVEQTGDFRICISGNTGVPGTEVGVQIFKDGKGAGDLENIKAEDLADWSEFLVFQDQEQADENGDFRIYADIYEPSGKYVVYSGASGSVEYDAESFVFINNEDFKNVAKMLNKQTSPSGIKRIIEENEYVLGLSPEEVAGVNADGLSEVLYETLKDTPFDENNRIDSWKTAQKALLVQRLNEGKSENIYDEKKEYSELFEEGAKLTKWVCGDFVTKELEKTFTAKLSGKSFDSFKEYKDSLTENFVLSVVITPNGTDNIKSIIKEFGSELGIKTDVADDVWSKLAGNNYQNKNELNAAIEKYNNPSKGGSGKKNTAGVGDGAIIPIVNNNTEENKLNPVIFDDLQNVSWAEKAIVYLAEKQIVSGVGNGKFNPNGQVTREQLVKMAVGVFLNDAKEADVEFVDVDENEWYAPYVKKAFSEKVVNGMGDGSFGIGRFITRQDLCVIIYKSAEAAGYKFKEGSGIKFADDDLISDYAKEAVYALKEAGAVSGVTQTEFMPQENATRAQAAKIIYYIMTEL